MGLIGSAIYHLFKNRAPNLLLLVYGGLCALVIGAVIVSAVVHALT